MSLSAPSGCRRPGSTSSCARSQLGEVSPHRGGGARLLECFGEDVEDLVVSAEVGEVAEREIHGPGDGAGSAELAQLGALAVPT